MLSLTSLFSASGVPNSEQVSGIADSGLPRRTSRMMSSPQVRREVGFSFSSPQPGSHWHQWFWKHVTVRTINTDAVLVNHLSAELGRDRHDHLTQSSGYESTMRDLFVRRMREAASNRAALRLSNP